MTTDRSPLALTIFEQVADLPVAAQAVKLDELCAGDAELRALVQAMLPPTRAGTNPSPATPCNGAKRCRPTPLKAEPPRRAIRC
jgi:hypothetical protein